MCHFPQSLQSRLPFVLMFSVVGRTGSASLSKAAPRAECTHADPTQQVFRIVALAALLSFAVLARGQVNPGTPSFSAYDSQQYDTINLQNLNVMLNVPVMSKSGAFPFQFALTGGNSYVYASGTNLEPGIVAVQLAGVADGILGYTGAYAAAQSYGDFTCANGSGIAAKFTNFILHFADGTVHALPATDYVIGAMNGYPGNCATSLTDQTTDGSGYTITVTGTAGPNGANNGYTVNSIYSRSGGNISVNSFPETVTDSHGNSVSYDLLTGVYTDTLGVSVLTASSQTALPTVHWTNVSGGSPQVAVTNSLYYLKSSFNCTGKTDFNTSTQIDLPTSISFPDSSSLALSYEPNGSGISTGRLSQLTLRSGGTVSYNYNPSNGANDGLNCTYLVPNKVTRTTSDGTTTYAWAHITNGNTTTVTDQGGNNTVYTFINGIVTQVQHYQGSSTLLTTDVYCYNAASGQPGNCTTAVVSLPVTEVDVYHTIPLLSAGSSRTQTQYDKYGNVTYFAQYDFGAATATLYTGTVYGTWNGTHCVAIGNNVNDKPCWTYTYSGSTLLSQSIYTYDTHGNLLQSNLYNGSTFLQNPTYNVYNSNGTPSKLYDLGNNLTSYSYSSSSYISCGSCTNYPFPTSISKGGLTTSSTWNGVGGVKLTDTDASLNVTNYGYQSSGGTADPWWRLSSVTDPLGNKVWKSYFASGPIGPFTESAFAFGSSVDNEWNTFDGYGRPILFQKAQSSTGTAFDTVSTSYGWSGNYRSVATSLPCSAASAGSCTAGITTTLSGPLGRPFTVTDAGGGIRTITYPRTTCCPF